MEATSGAKKIVEPAAYVDGEGVVGLSHTENPANPSEDIYVEEGPTLWDKFKCSIACMPYPGSRINSDGECECLGDDTPTWKP